MGNENVNSSAVFCSNCGGQLEIDSSKEYTECPYCGTKYSVSDLLGDTEAVRVEKIKSQAYKEVEKGKQQIESERLRQEALKNEEESIRKFKKGALSKVLIVMLILSAIFTALAFSNGKIVAGFVGLLMLVLFVISLFIGLHIIIPKVKNLHIITTIVAMLLFIPFFKLYNINSYSKDYKDFDWNNIKLHEFLPEPKLHSGEIISNSDESLSIYIKASENDYIEYVKSCIEKGYTVDSSETETTYSAFNSDGYDLSLYFSNDYYSLHLTAPEKLGDLEWPDSGLAKMLPVPKSKTGKIKEDSSGDFIALVGDTSEDDFKAYVKGCKEKGFDIDYSNGDDYYNAKCSDGYELEIRYKSLKIMEISLFEPYEFEEETTVAETTKAESSKAESSKTESSKAETSKSESSKTESSKAGSSKSESADDSDSSSSDNHNAIISEAEVAFENYGKSMYPYGFECHWFTNTIATKVYDDGSCLLKVGVTIKNQYGVTMNTVAEGKVSGSTVTYFFVYS